MSPINSNPGQQWLPRNGGAVAATIMIAAMPKCPLCLAAYCGIAGSFGLTLSSGLRIAYPLLLTLLAAGLIGVMVRAKRNQEFKACWFSVTGFLLLLSGKHIAASQLLTIVGASTLVLGIFISSYRRQTGSDFTTYN